jgi:hypothetical protein
VVAATVVLGAGHDDTFDLVLYSLLTLVLAAAGTLILQHQPRHGTGLLFWALAAWLGVTELADSYGSSGDRPGGVYGEWVISWSWVGDMTFWGLILSTFPNGRLLSSRWRVIPVVLLAGASLACAGFGLGTDDVETSFIGDENPLAVEGLPTLLMFDVGMPLVLLGILLGAASLVVRFRRSRGVERAQLKWFTTAGALVGIAVPFAVVLWLETVVVQVALGLAFLAVPVAAAVAILRYHLYDIDVVINRAVVYASLTVTLAGGYLLVVLLAQLVLPPRSALGTAASTLAAAALFTPARRRIQRAVDRSFFRSRFDVQQTITQFGERMRKTVTLSELEEELRGVVSETMRPTHVSLWLRQRT